MTLTPPRLDALQDALGLVLATWAAWHCWGWEYAVFGAGLIVYVDARWFDRAMTVNGTGEDRSVME